MSFIFITLLIDTLGWGLIIPVMADLVAELKHIPVNIASTYGAALLSAFAITQFLFAPVIGNLSDRFGRRPVLLSSLLGFGVDYMVGSHKWHGVAPNDEELAKALAQLPETIGDY